MSTPGSQATCAVAREPGGPNTSSRSSCRHRGRTRSGTAAPGELGGIPMLEAMTKGLTVRGVLQGDSTPARTIPRLWDLHRRGLLPFDRLITHYRLDQINQAAADTETGDVVKAVLLMPTT